MKKTFIASCAALSFALMSTTAIASDKVYADFPITLKGYSGDKTTSVAYTGQIARQLLHDSLKKLASQGTGEPNAELEARMLAYFETKGKGLEIIAPRSKGAFKISETMVEQIGGGDIKGKTIKSTVSGFPGGMTGDELIQFWIKKAAAAENGVNLRVGYNYPQLISKFMLGATMYNQAVDNYLDEKLTADNKPNDKPYSKGAYYTGKEHSWDEGFGYFGAPIHALSLSPDQAYSIAKRGGKTPEATLAAADYNKNGMIDLKTEMVYGPAYYAAGADRSGKTNYFHTIMEAFIDGRQVIADAKGEKLTDAQRTKLQEYAAVIETNWEQVLAEAVFKYAGSVYKDMTKLNEMLDKKEDTDKAFKKYVKHWGELKGFSLAIQAGRKDLADVGLRINNLVAAGPVLLNSSQVTDIDSKGNYLRDQGNWDGYMLHMVKLQNLMVEEFGIKARANDVTVEMAAMLEKLGDAATAEND